MKLKSLVAITSLTTVAVLASCANSVSGAANSASVSASTPSVGSTTYNTAEVGDVTVFYRAAGSEDNPAILLLHGFPSSSHQYRNLIPALSANYRVIAPDLPGFGSTVAPPRGEYDYTFENLAATIDGFTEALDLDQFAMYLFDYGAPVGFRIAEAHPERITAIVTQNGNAYDEGLTDAWGPLRAYWSDGSQENRDALRPLLKRETTQWQYVTGAPDALKDRISPDAINHDQAILDRDAEIQLDLFRSYGTNVTAYPEWQKYLRENKPPLLAIWGKNDPFFGPSGASAFKRDVPEATVELIDAGHFPLETHGELIAERVNGFLAANLKTGQR